MSGSPGASPASKRVAVAAACKACRQRKAKCSGERPRCEACNKRDVDCEYSTETHTETPREANKRKFKELETRVGNYEDLVKRISTGTWQEAIDAVQQFRHDQDLVVSPVGVPSKHPSNLPDDDHDRNFRAAQLIYAMCKRSDGDSSMILARLRMGEDWELIVKDLVDGQPVPSSAKSDASLQGPSFTSQSSLAQESMVDGVEEEHDQKTPWLEPFFRRSDWKSFRSGPRDTRAAIEEHEHRICNDEVAFLPSAMAGLTNNFHNLSFSSAVWANNYPHEVQRIQTENLFLPLWQMQTATGQLGDRLNIPDPFEKLFAQLKAEVVGGADPQVLCGPHAFIGALFDEGAFRRSPKVSQLVATMVKGIKDDDDGSKMTQCALMWYHWTLWCWFLNPTQESFERISSAIRPVPDQFFVPHQRLFDFVCTPKLRHHLLQTKTLDCSWLFESCLTIECYWPDRVEEGLERNATTGEVDLTADCKTHVSNWQNWSLGPTVRSFIPNLDLYIKVR